MRRPFGFVACVASVFALLLICESSVLGLTLKAASWRELREVSDCVVRARVASLASEATDEPGARGIQTRMKFSDSELLAGKKLPTDFAVILPGGELNGRTVVVPGAPRFVPGERVVLFLREIGTGDYALCGQGLGVLRESADGTRVQPDVPTRDGTPFGGETPPAFLSRFAESRATHSIAPAILGGVLALGCVLAAVLLRRRAPRVAAALLAGLALAGMDGFSKPSDAATPSRVSSREFQLEGVQWFLQNQRPGQVENGRVLWFQGVGTTHQTDADAFAVIAAQFQQWEDLPDSVIAFQKGGRTAESGTAIDSRNVVSFLKSPPRNAFDALTLAITFIQPIHGTNEILDADIVFNDRDVDWELNVGDYSLAAVSLHEIGHFLGLDHTSDPATVMFPTAGGLTVLSPGDQAGAAFIYPLQEAVPVAVASASPQDGVAPLDVSFSSDGSRLLDGSAPNLFWDFGDGTPASSDPAPVHTYTSPGVYTAKLSISNSHGETIVTAGLIVVDAAESTLTVSKLSYAASLLTTTRPADKIAMTFSGTTFEPGDRFRFLIGGALIGVDGSFAPFELDDTGNFLGDTNVGGVMKLRFDARKNVLTLGLSAAALGHDLDPREQGNFAASGSATLPVLVIVERKAGPVEFYTADTPVSYSIKVGRTALGVIEKSVQGKR